MIPGQIETSGYKQVTIQSDYDRDGKLIIGYDSQGDVYIQTDGYVRLAQISSSFASTQIRSMLRDLVDHQISDIKIGAEFKFQGRTFVCKKAPKGTDECEGCVFNKTYGKDPCGRYFCSADDRGDCTEIIFFEKGGDQ